MFKKKYKVRVVGVRTSYSNKVYYRIEYAYYRFIPNYRNIENYLWRISEWNPVVCCSSKEAEDFAKSVDTYEKLCSFHQEQKDLEKKHPKHPKKTKVLDYKIKQIV